MADTKKVQEQELRKLENQAYFELCQIIAEAMELQDVYLLDSRIASWKNKYKKLLDTPSTNSKSDFKKRIEFLLNQYYSSVTQYILSKLKVHEEKKVEKQAKALRELYTIIRDTNDYDLLKKKVNKWEQKYPISGFIKMYQKRIEYYTRDKNLKENSFKQEEAFRDLVDITKIHGTLDELKTELSLWEEKYSINDKYNIDDFIKHQSEVKRYTSDEFLQSIARDELEDNPEVIPDDKVQASLYASLIKISKSPNSVDEMFTWVYKNRGVKFNDTYKKLILTNQSIHSNYSPTYLKKLDKPKIDMSKSSLSYDEYLNITDIKRYAIISYFNLLLPPGKTIADDYFNRHIKTIYTKLEKTNVGNLKEETLPIDSGIEISLKGPTEGKSIISSIPETEHKSETEANSDKIETKPDENPRTSEVVVVLSDNNSEKPQAKEKTDENSVKKVVEDSSEIKNPESAEIVLDLSNTKPDLTIDFKESEKDEEVKTCTQETAEPLDHTTIVALSPLFFEVINSYATQAVLVNHIDSATTKYIEAKESSLDQSLEPKTEFFKY